MTHEGQMRLSIIGWVLRERRLRHSEGSIATLRWCMVTWTCADLWEFGVVIWTSGIQMDLEYNQVVSWTWSTTKWLVGLGVQPSG